MNNACDKTVTSNEPPRIEMEFCRSTGLKPYDGLHTLYNSSSRAASRELSTRRRMVHCGSLCGPASDMTELLEPIACNSMALPVKRPDFIGGPTAKGLFPEH